MLYKNFYFPFEQRGDPTVDSPTVLLVVFPAIDFSKNTNKLDLLLLKHNYFSSF